MDELKKKSMDEEAEGTGESLKGRIKEGVGKLTGDKDLEEEGNADQAEGKVRRGVGKAGRAVSDTAERVKDDLVGPD